MGDAPRARLLDGLTAAAQLKTKLARQVADLRGLGMVPGLGTILVGDDPASAWYVGGKQRDCQEVAISSISRTCPADVSEHELLRLVDELNEMDECTGFIVQLPLPKHINTQRVLERIDPRKDADGLHPMNLGRFLAGMKSDVYVPTACTPRAIITLLETYNIELASKHIVVVGRGLTVGRPLGALLTQKDINATVTLTHTGTVDLATHTQMADIVIAAAGVPRMIRAEQIASGAVVCDVGVSRELDPLTGKLRIVGDVDESVHYKAAWVSPNPGGVGPMTRALLLQNVIEIAQQK